MNAAREFLIYAFTLYGLFHLFCADFPFKTTDAVKHKCALIACACFLLALVLK